MDVGACKVGRFAATAGAGQAGAAAAAGESRDLGESRHPGQLLDKTECLSPAAGGMGTVGMSVLPTNRPPF